MPPDRGERPDRHVGATRHTVPIPMVSSPGRSVGSAAAERRADHEPWLASLRAYAHMAYDAVDPSDWLSAQLLDFADLLQVAEREGWFERERRRV